MFLAKASEASDGFILFYFPKEMLKAFQLMWATHGQWFFRSPFPMFQVLEAQEIDLCS